MSRVFPVCFVCFFFFMFNDFHFFLFFFFLMTRPPRKSPLFPSPPLSRSQVPPQVVAASPPEHLEEFGRPGSRVLERVVEEGADRATGDGLEPTAVGIQIMTHRKAREGIDGIALAARRRSFHLVAQGTSVRYVYAAHGVGLDVQRRTGVFPGNARAAEAPPRSQIGRAHV